MKISSQTNAWRDGRIFSLFCVLLGGTGQGIVAPKLPELVRGTDALSLVSGISGSVLYLGIFLSSFYYGKWADRGWYHRLMLGGLLLYAFTLAALAAASSPALLFVVRFLEGLALSAIYTASDFALGRLSPTKIRAQWLSYYGIALSLGLMLGPLICMVTDQLPSFLSFPVGSFFNFLMPFALVIFACLGCALLSSRFIIAPTPDPKIPFPKTSRAPLTIAIAYGALEAAIVAVFPILTKTEYRVSPERCLILLIVIAAVSSILWGWLADKMGNRPIIRGLSILLALGPTALFVLSGRMAADWIAYSSCVLFGILAGGLYPVGFAWLLESVPESQYGFASGRFTRFYGLGSLVGPVTAGIAAQVWGGKGFLFALGVLGVLTVLFLRRANLRDRMQITTPPNEMKAAS